MGCTKVSNGGGPYYDQKGGKVGIQHVAMMLACALKGLENYGTSADGMTVYRVSGNFAAMSPIWKTPGEVFSDPAFYSTSQSDQYYTCKKDSFPSEYRFKFTLKTTGSSCRGVFEGTPAISAHRDEQEVLCAPNTKFQVTSATQDSFGKKCRGSDKVWTIEANEI